MLIKNEVGVKHKKYTFISSMCIQSEVEGLKVTDSISIRKGNYKEINISPAIHTADTLEELEIELIEEIKKIIKAAKEHL